MDIPQYLIDWWLRFSPEPAVDPAYIVSGLTPVNTTGGPPESRSVTSPCKYWITGLPAPCQNWVGAEMRCGFATDTTKDDGTPTGYGIGGCDGLGRRHWCSKYLAVEGYDESGYVCVLPSIERSGSGKQDATVAEYVSIRPWRPSEIRGYNADETTNDNIGRCDGLGMGRGIDGLGKTTVEELLKLPPICKHYKAFSMGFGAVVPRPFHSSPTDPKQYQWKQGITYIPDTIAKLHDGTPADPLVMMDKRLPYSFKVYNLRAQFQKCAHWDDDYGTDFYIDEIGADASQFNITLGVDPLEKCTCESSVCEPFKTIFWDEPTVSGVAWIISEVWAKSNSIVCNGAKPECPCYTGKWIYCVDKNMSDGMRITANQILELRFWTSNWSSQAEYDAYFEEKPGPTQEGFADETVSDIYTFTKWKKLDPIDVNNSIMVGNKHHLCLPAPLTNREFIPSEYTTVTEIEYPKAGQMQGTHGPSDVAFPTLIRELPDGKDILPDITVIYPYPTIDPWNVEPCNKDDIPDYCFHDNNIMEGDPKICVTGSTVREKEVWAINITKLDLVFSSEPALVTMDTYVRAQLIPEDLREGFFKDVKAFIKENQYAGNGAYVYGTTDKYGYFNLPGLSLKNNVMNYIVVICKFTDAEFPWYTYRVRKVKSRYFGGLITQSTFEHELADIGSNNLLSSFSPEASIKGKVSAINGILGEVLPVYSLYRPGIYEDLNYYTYCVNEYETTEEDVIQWTQIGATEYIWVELGNLLISYLWDFTVVEAYLTLDLTEEGELKPGSNPSLCDSEAADLSEVRVNLQGVYPDATEEKRKSIPPDSVILKAPSVMGFFNSDWKLSIRYKFRKLENVTSDNVVFPDLSFGSINRFITSPYSVSYDESGDFEITNISRGTPAIMAKIMDEKGRTQAASAAKMLMWGHRLTCRNMDIHYSYEADAQAFSLEPSSGDPTWIGPPKPMVGPRVHSREPLCGDHLCSNGLSCVGPMWFPFDKCNSIDFYNVYNPASFCVMPITEAADNYQKMGGGGWRWGTADLYSCWVTTSSNWLDACGASFYYFYSKASNMRFSGKAFIRAKVDVFDYIFNSWELPPFGNVGRAMVERWLIRDYQGFIDGSGYPRSLQEYMPLVLDKEDLMPDLDCFAGDPTGIDIFRHTSILSNMVGVYNAESEPFGRYKFNDIIDLVYQGGCSYPLPIVLHNGVGVAIRYGLKNDDYCWVWPERQLPMETIGDTRLEFLSLAYPEYYFDYVKQEHQLILDEGYYKIIFKPPTDGNEEEDSDAPKYPSISINGQNPRYFKILYPTYDESNVEWQDESVDGEVGGSGGTGSDETEGSIYEKANGSEWLHDINMLFGPDSSPDKTTVRKVNMGPDGFGVIYFKYFNKGLIASIPKNCLHKLPIEETLIPVSEIIEDGNNIFRYHYDMSESTDACPVRIIVEGSWGFIPQEVAGDSGSYLSKPGINIAEVLSKDVSDEDLETIPFPTEVLVSILPVSGLQNKDAVGQPRLSTFTFDIELSKVPDRMMSKVQYFQIKIEPQTGVGVDVYEDLQITSVFAYTGKYVEREEDIFVYERRYLVSSQSIGEYLNADGLETFVYRANDKNGKNAGQYFPAEDSVLEVGGKTMSKSTIVTVAEVFPSDEEIPITYGTIRDVEKEAQANLYRDAYNLESFDVVSCKGIIPPYISVFLDDIVVDQTILTVSNCQFTNNKVPWEKEYRSTALNQTGEFFQPGGHYYQWSGNFEAVQCSTHGSIEKVYAVEFVHHLHGGTQSRQPTLWLGHSWTGWGKYGESEDGNFVGYLSAILENINMTGLGQQTGIRDITTLAQPNTVGYAGEFL